MSGLGLSWELVIADDGSTDGTRDWLRGVAARDERVRAVLLSRNFGHTPAYMAAFEHATGERIVLMDSDLQDEPEVIPRMLDLANEGHDVVYVVRGNRPEGPLMRLGFAVYYRLAGRVSSVPQPMHAGPFCMITRRVADRISELPERSLFFPGIRSYVGFSQAGLEVDRAPRRAGSSRISFGRRIAGALDGLLSFSSAPLRIASLFGIAIAGFTAVLMLFFIYFRLFTEVPIEGFTALVTVVLFVGGIQLLTVGIVGEYLARVYEEVKGRPRYVVEERLNLPPADEPPSDLAGS